MLARLRELGMLRRDKDPSQDLVAELFASAAGRMVCPACDHQGLSVSEAEAEDEWDDETWNSGRSCTVCGQPIAAERLAAFPDAQRCVTCQQAADRGADQATPDYCPRCGTPMTLRPRRGRGLAGYEMVCPQCKR
jgi:predicted RNA-binding Zn-ribbon protein involved in translation (DUF1610 family)